MGVNYNDCEDLVQKVLLELWKKLPKFDYAPNKCKFRTWMNTIVRNVVIDSFRKANRHQNDIKRASLQHINDKVVDYDIPDIYDIAEEEWETHIANLAWENIKDDFRGKTADCFLMFCDGVGIEEICEKLDIKRNTANVFKNRVQEKLHKEIRRLDKELS